MAQSVSECMFLFLFSRQTNAKKIPEGTNAHVIHFQAEKPFLLVGEQWLVDTVKPGPAV